jgi:hypothetical protein
MRRAALVALVSALAGGANAYAQDAPPMQPLPPPELFATETDRVAGAQQRFLAGEYSASAMLVGPLTRDPSLPGAVRAEAHRLYGLSLFLLGLSEEAEESLLAYLRLVPDAHLDPALVPPEAIVFFEEVRSRHAGDLLLAKPRPKQKRYFVLNFLPPFGQFQNGDRTKGWIIGSAELLFLATNVTTYFLLRSMCDPADATCGEDPGTATNLQRVNIAAGILAIVVYAFGVYDGLAGYSNRGPVDAAMSPIAITPSSDGSGALVWTRWGF